jgi:hypothetical protein
LDLIRDISRHGLSWEDKWSITFFILQGKNVMQCAGYVLGSSLELRDSRMCNQCLKLPNCKCGGVMQPLKSIPPAFKCGKCSKTVIAKDM